MDPIIVGLLVVLAMNLLIFPIAYKLQTDKLTDITYALSFATIAIYGYIAGEGGSSFSKMVMLGLILLWAIRLGFFLFVRVSKMGRDARFDQIRTNPKRFLRFFLIQAVGAWVIALPYLYQLLFNPGASSAIDEVVPLEWLGWGIALFGFILETIADQQKMSFKSKADNSGKLYTSGLYKIVRYPNYTGEILFWIGIFVACIPILSGIKWLSILGPIMIIALLLFLSGIPPIERSRKKNYGDDPEYQAYVAKTKKIIPGIF